MYIFQVSTSNLSCYTFSDNSCLPYIPQLHMEFFYKLKIFTRRIDILVWIFYVTTENLSGLLYTSGSDKCIPHFYMKIFYMLIYSAGARYHDHNHILSTTIGVTCIFHISTWNFFQYVENFQHGE